MASCAWAPTAVSGSFGRCSFSQEQAWASVYGAFDELLLDVELLKLETVEAAAAGEDELAEPENDEPAQPVSATTHSTAPVVQMVSLRFMRAHYVSARPPPSA